MSHDATKNTETNKPGWFIPKSRAHFIAMLSALLRSFGVAALTFVGSYLFLSFLPIATPLVLILSGVIGLGKFIGSYFQYLPALRDKLCATKEKPKTHFVAEISKTKKWYNRIVGGPIVFMAMLAEGFAVGAAVYAMLAMSLGVMPIIAIVPALLIGGGSFFLAWGIIAKKINKNAKFQDPLTQAEEIIFDNLHNKLKPAEKILNSSDKNDAKDYKQYHLLEVKKIKQRLDKISQKIKQDAVNNQVNKNDESDTTDKIRHKFAKEFGFIFGKGVSFSRAIGVGALTSLAIVALAIHIGSVPVVAVGTILGIAFGISRYLASYYQYFPDLSRYGTKLGIRLYNWWHNIKIATPKAIQHDLPWHKRLINGVVNWPVVLWSVLSDAFSNFSGMFRLGAKLTLVASLLFATSMAISLPLPLTIFLAVLTGVTAVMTGLGLTARKIREEVMSPDKLVKASLDCDRARDEINESLYIIEEYLPLGRAKKRTRRSVYFESDKTKKEEKSLIPKSPENEFIEKVRNDLAAGA